MSELLAPYSASLLALGGLGALVLAQILVADWVAIRRKHVPGTPVGGGHDDFLFRATRAHANTSESIGAVILIAAFAILVGGNPVWVNASLGSILVLRLLHTLAYYLDLRAVRSVAFALGFAALCLLFCVGVVAVVGRG